MSWWLLYRDEDDVAELIDGSVGSDVSAVSFERDPDQAILYCTLQKTS